MSKVKHKLKYEETVTASFRGLAIQILDRRTLCGEYAYPNYTADKDSQVTCKRCLRSLKKKAE